MMQWVKSGTRSACLFGVLLAVLAGCNGSDEKQANSTFDTVQTEQEPLIDDSKVPDVPVIGTVKAVPGTESPPPKVDGGKATPATGDRPTVMIGTGNTAGPGAEQAPGPAGGATANGGDDAIAPLFRHIDPPAPETLTVREGPFSKPVPEKATRFTETAPDTIGGATFQSSSALSYDLGNLVAVTSGDSSTFSNGKTFITPITGWLRYPEEALNGTTETAKYPVVVFLHGQHAINDPSYQGYDYLAADLAQHGYVVLSIDANAINADGDRSSQSRAQLVLGTLDRLRQIDGAGQINLGGSTGKLDPLKGRIDFTRIGIMGHSRGGQGVSNAIKFNKTRRGVTEADLLAAVKDGGAGSFSTFPDLVGAVAKSGVDKARFDAAVKKYNIFYAAGSGSGVPPYVFKGAFMLAPTDFGGNTGLDSVPLAVLLPTCDGDMKNLQGARAFDHNRFGPDDDTTPRYQIMVKGGNHNFYNRKWAFDDHSTAYCDYPSAGIRLTREDQERNGKFIINSFMRSHVGSEQKFAAYWNGTAQQPAAACPSAIGPCDERVVLTVQKDAGRRKLIQRFKLADSMSRNLLGGPIEFTGFDATALCDMPTGASDIGGECSPRRLEGFEYYPDRDHYDKGMRSVADHAELAWSKAGASVVTDLTGLSITGYDTLTFRLAVVQPIGQEAEVTLADSAGNSATLMASDFSDALYLAPRSKDDGRPMTNDSRNTPFADDQVKTLLNMVAIPLRAFEGVDMTKLKELKLTFPKESGKVAITDIELQNLGREKPAETVVAKQ